MPAAAGRFDNEKRQLREIVPVLRCLPYSREPITYFA
jgi:hypothetical protein